MSTVPRSLQNYFFNRKIRLGMTNGVLSFFQTQFDPCHVSRDVPGADSDHVPLQDGLRQAGPLHGLRGKPGIIRM
jgi:hypothetical protein